MSKSSSGSGLGLLGIIIIGMILMISNPSKEVHIEVLKEKRGLTHVDEYKSYYLFSITKVRSHIVTIGLLKHAFNQGKEDYFKRAATIYRRTETMSNKTEKRTQLLNALNLLDSAIYLQKKSALYYKLRGNVKNTTEIAQYYSAITDLTQAIHLGKKENNLPAAYYGSRGLSYQKTQQYSKALQDFRKALSISKTGKDKTYLRGKIREVENTRKKNTYKKSSKPSTSYRTTSKSSTSYSSTSIPYYKVIKPSNSYGPYKKGATVKIKKGYNDWIKQMDSYIGNSVTIKSTLGKDKRGYLKARLSNNSYVWTINALELLDSNFKNRISAYTAKQGYGGLYTGKWVKIEKGYSNWDKKMDQYVGKVAKVKKLCGKDKAGHHTVQLTGCGNWYWNVNFLRPMK